MSVLFRLVYASKCNGTHHKLAMDALRYLNHPESEGWIRLFLKHADSYIEGSKAPDKRFRDFRNHVLHVEENYWGGAVKTAQRWYEQALTAFQQQNWKEAIYSAGVLSHYYTDPVMPFHTGQSEEETQIHRAVEWSISKSYDHLFALFESEYQSEILRPKTDARHAELVQALVLQGASLSHRHYVRTIEHYNLDVGVQDPPAGLDALLRETYAKLLGYAALGFARILEELIRDTALHPPEVSLTLESILTGIEIPIRWVTRKIADREERLQIEAIYQEFVQTGRVVANLPEDDRLVRQWHAEEVQGITLNQLNQQTLKPLGTEFGRGGDVEKTSFLERPRRDLLANYEQSRNNKPGVVTTIEVIGPKQSPPTETRRPTIEPTPSMPPKIVAETKPKIRVKQIIEPKPIVVEESRPVIKEPVRYEPRPEKIIPVQEEIKSTATERLKYYLHRSDPLVDAPSIGPKTAKRFRKIGIQTVDDFLNCDPEATADKLQVRYITPEEIRNWQDQAELVCRIPNLRGHDAQILVYSGIRKVEHLDGWEPQSLLDMVQPFVESAEGVRLLRGSGQPDLAEVTNWLRWSGSARSLRAA
ncbi:MAG: DUF4332 domain-containing protein [Planctomycetaceae bacterium]|nr:DUF4332 domain-containing protein [Planctomycetaceae bacterium]